MEFFLFVILLFMILFASRKITILEAKVDLLIQESDTARFDELRKALKTKDAKNKALK